MLRLVIPCWLVGTVGVTAGGLTSIPLSTSVNSAAFAREWGPATPPPAVGLYRPALTWRPAPVWEAQPAPPPVVLLAKAQTAPVPAARQLADPPAPKMQFASVEKSNMDGIIEADFHSFAKKTNGQLVDAQVKVRRKRRGAPILPGEGARRFTVHARLESKSGARVTFTNGAQEIEIPNVQFEQNIQIPTMAASQTGTWRLILEVKEPGIQGSTEKNLSTHRHPFIKKALITTTLIAVCVLPIWHATDDPTRTTIGLGPGRVSIP